MPGTPREPQQFAEHIVSMLRQRQPSQSIELIGPSELMINGRRLDLQNLLRMVNHDPTRGDEIIAHYFDQLLAGDTARLASVSLDFARPRLMPRIQPESIFQHLGREQVAHTPFVNGTVIVFVIDLPQMTVSATTEQLIRWGLCVEEIEQIARENLEHYAPELEVQIVESKEGGRAAILSEQDGYDAARLLLTDLHRRLAPSLGSDFYVATPARDMFVALSPGPDEFIHRLRHRVGQDFERLPYPITPDLFLVTRDGVAGTREDGAAEEAA